MMTIQTFSNPEYGAWQRFFCCACPWEKQVDAVSGFKPGDLSGLLLATRLALMIVLPLLAALLLGWYLGRIYGHEAFFMLAALCVALAGGFRQAIRMLLKK